MKKIESKYKKAWAIKTDDGEILYPIFRTKKKAIANCKNVFAEVIKIQIKQI